MITKSPPRQYSPRVDVVPYVQQRAKNFKKVLAEVLKEDHAILKALVDR